MVGNLFCDKVCLGTIRITPVTAERLTKDRVVRFLQTLWIIIRKIVIQMIVNWWYTFWYHTQDKSDFRYSGFLIQKFGTSTMYKFTVLRGKLNFSHQPWVSCKILTNTTWLLPWFCCRHPPLLQLYIIYKLKNVTICKYLFVIFFFFEGGGGVKVYSYPLRVVLPTT